MGFFSNDCNGCGHSIRHRGATMPESRWMSQAVAMDKEGSRLMGEYDGYGNIGGMSDGDGLMGYDTWHRKCWELAGKPEFTKASRSSHDQGHFVGEYDPPEPKTVADMEALSKVAEQKRDEDARAWKEAMAKYHAENGNNA